MMVSLYILLGLIFGLSLFCLYLLGKVSKLRVQVLFLYKSVKQIEDVAIQDWKSKLIPVSNKIPPPPTHNPFKTPPLGTNSKNPLQNSSAKVVSLLGWRTKKDSK